MSNSKSQNQEINQEERKYWVAFSRVSPKFGSQRFKKLYTYFPSLKEAWHSSFEELKRAGIEENVILEFMSKKDEILPGEEWEKLEKEEIKVITLKDKDYPKLLKEIYNPPAILYYKGRLSSKENEFSLAVVGTRKMTSYGKQITSEIVRPLAENGIIIVSGLALGIDALAHSSALEAEGKTIGVLGSGLDKENIYPSANRFLAQKILEKEGALISEHPLGTPPLKHHFPHRNRIISGLALGTLVIEAPEDSGALLTARFALEQGREIFAVPGSIYSSSAFGPNNLIKMGAKLVTSFIDILEALNLSLAKEYIESRKIVPDTKEEAELLKFLSYEPIYIDEMVRKTQLETAQVSSTLTLMEMKGKVRDLGGMNYVLAR